MIAGCRQRLHLAVSVFAMIVTSDAFCEDLKVKPYRKFNCSSKAAITIATDHTQRLAATAGTDNMVSLWDLQTSKQLRNWKPSASTVIDLAFHPTAALVASASYPKRLTLYDVKAGKQLWQSETLYAPMRVTFSRDGSKIAVGSSFGKASIYDATTGKRLVTASNDEPNSNAVAFSGDGKSLFIAGNTKRGSGGIGRVIQLDAITGKPQREFGNHPNDVVRIKVSPSGKHLVALDRGGLLSMWDLTANRQVGDWKLGLERTNNCHFIDDQTVLVGAKGNLAVVRLGNPSVTVTESAGVVHHVAALPDRGLIASTVGAELRLFQFDRSKIKSVSKTAPIETKRTKQSDINLVPGANEPPEDIRFDGLVSREELIRLIGQPLAIKLNNGRLIAKVSLHELQFDRSKHGLRFLKYQEETGRPTSIKVTDLYAFWIGDQRYQLRYFPPTKQLFVVNTKVADALAESRLAASGKKLRDRLSEDEQKAATEEHKRFLQDAAKKLKSVATFFVDESETTLLFTDYPPAAMGGVKNYVDGLNQQLNQMFGVPRGDSVWRGKPIVAVFSSPSRFGAFEEKVMNNPNHNGLASVRSGPKRFLQTSIAKRFGPNDARALAWGYSLGFAQRLHSDHRSVPWMNMGIANVVQFAIVPDKKRQSSQRKQVATQIGRAQSLLGLLSATRLEQERRPLSGEVVRFLLSSDPIAFSQMFRDVKLGVPVDDALQQNFAIGKEQLAIRFGRSMGIAGVAP